ncbi:MAG: A/G-specific adenine glycosylase [Arenicellales bacterium WSBS_2016_MAG_OTU3]
MPDPIKPASFSRRLLKWHTQHGRHNLPWQQSRDPYCIWVSEIMLQQTRVTTVIPYYQRFIQRFPNIKALASALQDDVLHYWTGLGYYARARNLHKAAQTIVAEHGGKFPKVLADVVALPGIGPSTAGAILAFAFGQRHSILDGNVKRVLARVFAIKGYPGERKINESMWELADSLTPIKDIAQYTQAIMDLGATVCVRGKPACGLCPLQTDCLAIASGNATLYPTPKPKKERPLKSTVMLMLSNNEGEVFLQRRPPAGIWGGLWGFPEFAGLADVVKQCEQRFGFKIEIAQPWPEIRHGFTHYELQITPLPATLAGEAAAVMEADAQVWYNVAASSARGFAAPVKLLLQKLIPH